MALVILGLVVLAFNFSTQEAEAGDLYELQFNLVYLPSFQDSKTYIVIIPVSWKLRQN